MNKIILKKVKLTYFKGAKELSIDFNPTTTNIHGGNGLFKTTVFDAFTWLLFGKDSQGNSDSKFEIKTLRADNSVIEKVDHEVSAIIDYNGRDLPLRRIFREKWEKKRGDLLAAFTGHETICYFDDVPVSITEYNKRIGEMMNENIFRLITSPLYFNSLPWKDRRNVLIELAGQVSNAFILEKATNIANKGEMAQLIMMLNEGKSIEDIKARTTQQKKTVNDQLKQIPTRIDEVRKGTPEAEDYEGIESAIGDKVKAVAAIDEQIADRSKALNEKYKTIDQKRGQISQLQSQQNTIVFNAQQAEQKRVSDANMDRSTKESELRIAKSELNSLQSELYRSENDLSLSGKINAKKNSIDQKRNDWILENEKQYQAKSGCLICPVFSHECSDPKAVQKHSESQQSALNSFNASKQQKLDEIHTEGMRLSGELKKLQEEQSNLTSRILQERKSVDEKKKLVDLISAELAKMEVKLPALMVKEHIKECIELENQIKAIQATIETVANVDNSDLVEQKKSINAEIDALKSHLSNKGTIEANNKRIEQLLEEEQYLAQQVASMEGIEFAIQEFSKAQMEEIDRRVNGKFKYVKFKLFEKQINGSEVECCQTLVNGVPFGTGLNNAACINAGVDIINALCEKNSVSAPIFIDNRESVNELIPSSSQIINLIVSTDKVLTIK